jgi:peptidylprolyl isomerase
MAVKNGDTVHVHYKGTLVGGKVFDASEGRDPLTFTLGAGQVIPGFESAVIGLEPGGTVTVTIDPENAYGPHLPQLAHTVSFGDFSSEPALGGVVNLTSPEGEVLPGRVVGIEGDAVHLDFNHPLAGETLTFEIELVSVDPAAPESDAV